MKERKDPAAEAQQWLEQNAGALEGLGKIAIVTPVEQAIIAEQNAGSGHNGNSTADQPEELNI